VPLERVQHAFLGGAEYVHSSLLTIHSGIALSGWPGGHAAGYGAEVMRQIAQLVHAAGATQLLTSYVPRGRRTVEFYERLGFVPTGELDSNGEAIVRLALPYT
jgi:GNAT superfamily N-acetyltransferase